MVTYGKFEILYLSDILKKRITALYSLPNKDTLPDTLPMIPKFLAIF